MAVFPYSPQTEIINTAVLDGTTISAPVELYAAYTSGQILPYNGAVSCTASNPDVLTVSSSCSSLQLLGSEITGSDAVNVTFMADGQSGVLPMRIYYPQLPLVYTTTDTELNRIQYSLDASNCVAYQQTILSVSINFIAGNRVLSDVIVNDILLPTLAVNDSAIATLTGNAVYGLSPGAVEVCPSGRQNLGCVEIVVLDESVNIARVIGSLLVELSLESNSSVAAGVVDIATIRARSQLQFERERGDLLVAVLYSDNTYASVNASEVTLLPSTDSSIYAIQDRQVVAVGSGEVFGSFTWAPPNSQCNLLVTEMFPVSVSLPLPVALQTSLLPSPQTHSITTPGNAAALIGIPTQLVLQVELEYPGGQRLDVTSDSRVTFSQSMNLINIDRSGTITASGQASGMVQLTVSFNTSAVNLTALIQIEVIRSSGVRLEAFPYPSYPGSDANPITALSLIEDTGVYQRALLRVQLLLSNNNTRDVSSHASTTFSTQVVIGTPNPQISSSNVLSVVSNGVMDIILTFGPDTIRVLFIINNTPVRVTGISVNPLSSNTLRGIAGMSFTQASVDLTFSDGTQFVNFPTSSAFTSFPIPGLVSYSSPSGSSSYSVTQDGRLQPLMNTITPVTLQATAGVSPISGTTDFVVNLDPDVGDVDLGQENGVAIPQTQLGAMLVIPVRVNTGGHNLGSIDILVMYDSSVLAAVSVDIGPDWGSGVNDASLNDPPGEIRFGGALFVDGVAGTRLHLFTLRLRVISGTSSVSRSFLRGTVLTFAERNINGTNIGPVTPRPIVAGNLTFEIQNNVGKRSASRTERHSPIIHTPAAHKLLRERRATGSCPSPPCPCSGQCPGDTDGNCVFDIRDVTYALIYITESLLNFNTAVGQEIQTRITSAQLQQLDPTLDGIVNTNDAYFLLRAVFRLIYFLEDVQVTPIQDTTSGCLLTIQVWLRDADNSSVGQVEVVTDVAFRNSLPQAEFVSSMLVRGTVLTSNKGAGLNGGLILAERTFENVFIIQFMSDIVASDIGVSVIAVSFDAQNSTSTSRMIQFLGPPPPMYTASLDLSLSIRDNPVQVAALSGYSPLQTFSNTIPSSQCSDLPLLTSELNVTFPSPFQAELQWGLLNMRMGLDFTSLLQLSIYNCSVDQSGTTMLDNCTAPIQTPVQNDTIHSLPVRPFTDYFFQVSGSTTNTSLVKERSPEAPPEGVDVPSYSYFESGIHFSWSLPSTPNGIITHYTLYVDGVVVYNGSSTARTLQSDITQPLNYSLEAHNSAGSTTSETGVVVTPTSVSATRSPGLNIAITDFIIIAAVLTVSALIVLISAMTYGMVRIRQAAKDKPPSFLSSDFFTENFGVVSYA